MSSLFSSAQCPNAKPSIPHSRDHLDRRLQLWPWVLQLCCLVMWRSSGHSEQKHQQMPENFLSSSVHAWWNSTDNKTTLYCLLSSHPRLTDHLHVWTGKSALGFASKQSVCLCCSLKKLQSESVFRQLATCVNATGRISVLWEIKEGKAAGRVWLDGKFCHSNFSCYKKMQKSDNASDFFSSLGFS